MDIPNELIPDDMTPEEQKSFALNLVQAVVLHARSVGVHDAEMILTILNAKDVSDIGLTTSVTSNAVH